VIIATSIVLMPVWLFIARRLGKPRTFGAALTGYTLVMSSWLLGSDHESVPMFIVRAVGVGMFSGGLLISSQSMVLDAIAADRRRSGISREAMLMALYALSEKVAGAIGPLLVGLILSTFGFQPHQAANERLSSSAHLGLEIALVWMMVAVTIACLGLLRRYREVPA
jgi:GPH family glycoside/pentoside/hexuronide:cation symporter